MKRIILLSFILLALTAGAQQDFYTSGSCKAGFKFDVNHTIKTFAPATVLNFYDTSFGKVKEWYWDFGNGEYSREQNPVHIFNHPISGPTVKISPYRTISLTIVTDSCKSIFRQTINIIELGGVVQQNCFAHFKYFESARDSVSGTAAINFVNGSSGNNLKYLWQFGDGTTSTEKEPVKKFSLKQTEYKVCLTVTGTDSCVNTFCDAVYIQKPEPVCQAHFKYQVTKIDSLNKIAVYKFYNGSMGSDLKYSWQFGNGMTSTEKEPEVKLSFTQPEYKVCLTVTGANNCTNTYCIPVNLVPPVPVITDPVLQCYAAFGYDLKDMLMSPLPSMVASFYSKTDPIAKEYFWEFGDGTTSKEPNPTHVYIKKSDSLSALNPYREVCLTVVTSDGCKLRICQKVPVFGKITPIDPVKPPVIGPLPPVMACPYKIKVDGGFPIQMSSCAGWASAKVYNVEGKEVLPKIFSWSTGDTVSKVSGLCPTKTYTVKALMPEGCVVYYHFILNANGSITETSPANWSITGSRDNQYIKTDVTKNYMTEWKLCDGTIVKADSIPLNAINCGGTGSNYILKDSLGNVVYSENIALKGLYTGVEDIKAGPQVKLWPNPVNERLNIRYSGEYQNELKVEICDIVGKTVAGEIYRSIPDGYEFSIDTTPLRNGIYICRIISGGKLISAQKISKK